MLDLTKYVEAGRNTIKIEEEEIAKQVRQQEENERKERSAYGYAAMEIIRRFVPEELIEFIEIDDSNYKGNYWRADVSLDLPGCYLIEFLVWLNGDTDPPEFHVNMGTPELIDSDDGEMFVQNKSHDEATSENLEKIIAIAFDRQQLENKLKAEADAINASRTQAQEVQARQEKAQEILGMIKPATEPAPLDKMTAALKDYILDKINEVLDERFSNC